MDRFHSCVAGFVWCIAVGYEDGVMPQKNKEYNALAREQHDDDYGYTFAHHVHHV